MDTSKTDTHLATTQSATPAATDAIYIAVDLAKSHPKSLKKLRTELATLTIHDLASNQQNQRELINFCDNVVRLLRLAGYITNQQTATYYVPPILDLDNENRRYVIFKVELTPDIIMSVLCGHINGDFRIQTILGPRSNLDDSPET